MVLLALLVGAVAFVGAPVMAGSGIEANSQWNLTFCWDGASCANATWYVTPPTFSDSQGNSGTVDLTNYPAAVCLNYTSGCFPAYGTMQLDFPAGTASGEMQGVDCHGIWSATRNCKNCQAPAPVKTGRGPDGG